MYFNLFFTVLFSVLIAFPAFAQEPYYVNTNGDTVMVKELDKKGAKIKGVTKSGEKFKLTKEEFTSFYVNSDEWQTYDVVSNRDDDKKVVRRLIGVYKEGNRIYEFNDVGLGKGVKGTYSVAPGAHNTPGSGATLKKETCIVVFSADGKYLEDIDFKNAKETIPKYMGDCYSKVMDEYSGRSLGLGFGRKFEEKVKELEPKCK